MTKTLEELEQQFDEAATNLEALRSEQRAVLTGFAAAVAAKDSKAVAAYVKRRGELPAELADAEIAAISAELALLDAENVVDDAKVNELKPQAAAAEQALKEAQAALLSLQNDLGRLGQRISGRRSKKIARDRRLEALLREQLGQSEIWPIVRSKQTR